ncbi:MAG: glycosyltransferase family 2 protein [Planctomycetota bacterium]
MTPVGVTTRRYALIAPCRDEQQYMERTLESVYNQTESPALFVVVDDASTDETPNILRKWQEKMPYLRVVTRPPRPKGDGGRKVGGGVVQAFYAGYETIDPAEFDYVCKIDLDLELPEKYFATLMDKMESNPRLGTASGKPYMLLDGQLVSEKCGDENSVGMTKFYQTRCFTEIGGFVPELMWDGIDCHTARMMGWQAASFDEPDLRFTHLRPMGTSHKNWWTGRVRHGWGQQFMGTSLPYMLASCAYRALHPPILVGSAAMLWGFIKRSFRGEPRYDKPGFRKFLRRYQWAALFKGKSNAITAIDAEQKKVWDAKAK